MAAGVPRSRALLLDATIAGWHNRCQGCCLTFEPCIVSKVGFCLKVLTFEKSATRQGMMAVISCQQQCGWLQPFVMRPKIHVNDLSVL
jgi:hypothetical protein